MRAVREFTEKRLSVLVGAGGGLVAGSKKYKYTNSVHILIVVLSIVSSIVAWKFCNADGLFYALSIIWGICVGVTLLFVLPAKLLATAVGAVAGLIFPDLATAPSLIAKFNLQICNILIAVKADPNGCSPAPIWIFIVIVALLCLPAYATKLDD